MALSSHAIPDGRQTAPAPIVHAGFDRRTPGLIGDVVLGTVAMLLTVGLFRFWYVTMLRRELWWRSRLGGHPFEYTGTVLDLVVGLLRFAGCLMLVCGIGFVGTLKLGPTSTAAAMVSPMALVFLAAFARFDSRSFRLSRTVYRGVRFGQSGSAVLYAVIAVGWTLLSLISLGLAVPFMRAALERYRINRTRFGDRPFRSAASAPMVRWLVLWVLWIVPPTILAGWLFMMGFRFSDVGVAYQFDPGFRNGRFFFGFTGVEHPELLAWTYLLMGWLVIMPLLAWPFYRAAEVRSFLSAVTFGRTRFRSTIDAGSIYLAWTLFVLVVIAGTAIAIASLFGFLWLASFTEPAQFADLLSALVPIVAGLIFAAIFLIGRTLTLRIGLWRAMVDSIVVENPEGIADVQTRVRQAGAVSGDIAATPDFGGR